MNGYSKIGSSNKSRSIDFSDFLSFPPQLPKPICSRNTTLQPAPAAKHTADEVNNKNSEDDENGNKGQRFGVILGRSCSVSAAASSASGFQATMKRAFSGRRSSSVTERYCRIHDQSMAIASDELVNIDDGGDATAAAAAGNTKKKNNRGGGGGGRGGKKFLKACKRLFGI